MWMADNGIGPRMPNSAVSSNETAALHTTIQSESKVCLENLRAYFGNQNNKESFYEHRVENSSLPRYYR
jgi:hypothetical protein